MMHWNHKHKIKLVCCSYDANFKLMAIKDTEKSNNCTAALKLHTVEQNVQQLYITAYGFR